MVEYILTCVICSTAFTVVFAIATYLCLTELIRSIEKLDNKVRENSNLILDDMRKVRIEVDDWENKCKALKKLVRRKEETIDKYVRGVELTSGMMNELGELQ